MHKDTLGRIINVGDIVCHANGSKYWGGAYVGKVLAITPQMVRLQYTSSRTGTVRPDRCAIMRSEDVKFSK